MEDRTELIRRAICAGINSNPDLKESIESREEKTWDTNQLGEDFEVLSFAAPFVIVRRKSDGQKGAMMFQHRPRFYWGFIKDEDNPEE